MMGVMYYKWLLEKLMRYGTSTALRDSTSTNRKLAYRHGHIAYGPPIKLPNGKRRVNGPFITQRAVEYLKEKA